MYPSDTYAGGAGRMLSAESTALRELCELVPPSDRRARGIDADCSAEDYWVHPRIGPPQWDLAAILEDLAITKRSLNLPPPSSAALEDGHPLPA